MTKFLMLSDNHIFTIDTSGDLENVTSSINDINSLTQEEYEDYGFDGVSDITRDHLDTLTHPIKLLYYKTDVDNLTPTPTLRQEYNLNVGVRQMIIKPN